MNKMMKKVLSALGLVLVVQCFGTSMVRAQPDINNAPKGVNPPNRRPGGLKAGLKKPPTPEQVAKRRAKKIQARIGEISTQLTEAGFTDETLQSSIIAYYTNEQDARAKVSEQYQQIIVALKDKNTPNTQLATMLVDLRASVAEENTRQEKASADFSAKLKLSGNPRLDALLMTLGVTGNERALASQADGMDNLVNTLGKTAKTKVPVPPQ